MQENSRTYENMESWDEAASGPQKTHNMTPQQRKAQFGNQWNGVQTTGGGSNKMPTRQHLDFGQAHRARMRTNISAQRATASQAGSPFYAGTATKRVFFYSSERDRESCDLSGKSRTTHSRFSTSFVTSGTMVVEVEQNLYGSRLTFGVQKSVSLLCHICSVIHFTDADGTVAFTTFSSTSPLLPSC